MARALVLLFFLLFFVGGSDAVWCVCRSDQPTSALQKTIDFACGAGADCTPILQNGVCFNPNTVVAHCSYAANSYFQRNGQAQTACNFSETCTMSTTDPSYSGCSYPSTAIAAGTSGTPTSGTPTSTTGTPTSFTPVGTTTGSTTGGIMSGLGPTGTSSYDTSGIDSSYHPNAQPAIFFFPIIFSLALAVV